MIRTTFRELWASVVFNEYLNCPQLYIWDPCCTNPPWTIIMYAYNLKSLWTRLLNLEFKIILHCIHSQRSLQFFLVGIYLSIHNLIVWIQWTIITWTRFIYCRWRLTNNSRCSSSCCSRVTFITNGIMPTPILGIRCNRNTTSLTPCWHKRNIIIRCNRNTSHLTPCWYKRKVIILSDWNFKCSIDFVIIIIHPDIIPHITV